MPKNTNNVVETGLNQDLPFDQKNLFTLVIENLPDQIYLKDAESRFILCNTPVALNAGYSSPDDIIGKTDFDLHPQEAQQFFNDEQSLMKLDRSLINHEEQFVKSGTDQIKWNLSTKVPIKDSEGKVVGLLGINRDITQMKKALLEREVIMKDLVEQAADLKTLNEQLTRQKEQELEKAIAQGKFEIASEVLHDIGNALVGFGSYLNRINRALDKDNIDTISNLDLFIKSRQTQIAGAIGTDKAAALSAITEGITHTQKENRAEIGNSVNELLNIVTHIQEILTIQRQFVRGHGGLHERKPVNLVNIIDDCRAMLFASFDKKGIQLKTDIKPGNYIIKGDQTKLMQVMLNILKNSIEAIGFETIEKIITIALQNIDDTIELKIIDNGHGFDKKTGDQLFERGFTTKKSGTGLGLYNCRSIVESHSGKFKIKSDGPGLGAVTIIRF